MKKLIRTQQQDLVALREKKNGGSSSSLESEMNCGRRENNKIFL